MTGRCSLPALAPCLAALLVACGPTYEAQSTFKGVRIIGVQKDKPYARPGDTVKLSMLLHDGAAEKRQVSVKWFGGCDNPIGDSYPGCFFGSSGGGEEGLLGGLRQIGEGLEAEYAVPADILNRPPPPGNVPPYGLSFVFFTACTGALEPAPGEKIPIQCVDGDGQRVDADGFVVGYSQIFAYDELTNENPVVEGLSIRGTEFKPGEDGTPVECLGDDCVQLAKRDFGIPEENPGAPEPEPPEEPADCDPEDVFTCNPKTDKWCVDHCTEGDIDDCPKHGVQVLMTDADNAEIDGTSPGSTRSEQMWVNYYVDRGKLDGDIKIVRDAVEGWQPTRSDTEFFAPMECGPFHVWAAAHDNRGGVQWVRARLYAR